MRRLLAVTFALSLALLLLAGQAHAQYSPPPPPNGQSAVGFMALGKTTRVAASTSSAQGTLSALSGQVQVFNPGAGIAYVIFGTATQSPLTASVGTDGTATTDYVIAPGSVIVCTVPAGTLYAAVILSTGSYTVYFTPGAGL